mgnify:CR=1 FL=1
MVLQVILVLKVLRVSKESVDQQVLKEQLVHKDQQVLKEQLVHLSLIHI